MNKFLQTLGSLKIMLWLFLALGLFSLLGVIIPQQPGRAGLHDLYNSTAFIALLVLCALNLTTCVIIRILANFRQVFHKDFLGEPEAFRAMKHYREIDKEGFADTAVIHLTGALKRRGYAVTEKRDEERCMLYASKGKLSKIGSILLHLGALVIFTGGLVSSRTGYTDFLMLAPGQSASVKKRDCFVRVDDFRIVLNNEGRVKSYESDVTLTGRDGKPLLTKTIRVNDPLIHDGIHFYQSSYGEAPDAVRLVRLQFRAPGLDTVLEAAYDSTVSLPGGLTLRLHDYYSDLSIDMQTREPSNRSNEPNNPALKARVLGAKGDTLFHSWLYFNHPDFQGMRPDSPVRVTLEGYRPQYRTGLQVRENLGVPYVLAGLLMTSLGLLMLLYIPVRRIYALALTAQGRTRLLVSGTSNRFEEGFTRELNDIVDGSAPTARFS